MGHQVSVAFPKNITLLEFFRVILVHSKSFLSTFYQLRDSNQGKTVLHVTEFAPYGMQFMQKYWSNKKNTL